MCCTSRPNPEPHASLARESLSQKKAGACFCIRMNEKKLNICKCLSRTTYINTCTAHRRHPSAYIGKIVSPSCRARAAAVGWCSAVGLCCLVWLCTLAHSHHRRHHRRPCFVVRRETSAAHMFFGFCFCFATL